MSKTPTRHPAKSVTSGSDVPNGDNFNAIQTYLVESLGLTLDQASGVLGNFWTESSFSPTAYNPNEGAHGIAQWENGRYGNLVQYAASHNASPDALSTQLGFLKHELTGPFSGAYADLKNATTAGQAATVFDKEYEISSPASLPTRVAHANQLAYGTPDPGTNPAVGNAINGPILTKLGVSGVSALDAIKSPFELAEKVYKDFTTTDFWIRVGFIVLGFFILLIGVDKLSGGGISGSSNPNAMETVDVVVGNRKGNTRTATGRVASAPARATKAATTRGESGASTAKHAATTAPTRAVESAAE